MALTGLLVMARNVVDRDFGLKAFVRELQRAKTVEVVVGLLEGPKNDGVSIAEYGAYNEYGTGRIPSRPFMRESFDENVGRINSDIAKEYDNVMTGQKSVYAALSTVGMKHQDRVKKKIGSNMKPANAPSTIAKKKSSHTLIDTGAMLNSVNYIVRGKS